MASERGGTSFAALVEEIPLESYEQSEDEVDGSRNEGLRRASTDAHLSEFRPRQRVRFHTLASGMEKQLSNEGIELLSAKAHQIGHANWSGGWQNTVLRRRCKGWSPRSEEEEVQEIAQAMEEDPKLMSDDVDGEVLRRDALRELTKSLKVKKEIKERLRMSKASVRSSEWTLSCYKSFKYSLSMKWYRFKENIEMALHDYSLWHKDLKAIEGIYGTSVGSYFRFLRYLFLLNSWLAFIIVCFLLVPQIHYSDKYGAECEECLNSLPNNSSTMNNEPAATLSSNVSSLSFGVFDWLTGAGWFSGTQLYYGGYSTGTLGVDSFNSTTLSYNMSEAYFFTVTFCFIFYLLILLYRIFTMYRVNYIDAQDDLNVIFVEKVFSAWDFNITDKKSASIKRRSIYNELIEMLQECQDEEMEGFIKRMVKRILQSLVWFVLVSFLLLLGWGLYLLLKDQLHDLPEHKEVYWKESLEMLVYPLIVTILMVVIPMVFEAIGRMEKYSKPRYELYANVIRVSVLELVILVALIVFWYENSPGLKDELKALRQTLLISPGETSEEELMTANQTSVQCWENALGEEIYRLVFIDFLVILVSTLVVDSLKPFLVRSQYVKESILQFCIPRNTLHIVYNQTLLWAGIFFCPLLPLIISLKFFLIFYLQKFTVTRNLQPIDRPWRAAQTETLFYALTLLSLLLAVSSYGFILFRGYSSPTCGPFQGYIHYIDIVWEVSGDSEKVLLKVVSFILRPGIIFLFTLILSLCVYCVKNISEGRAQLVSVLRSQLELEMKDRVFLQRLIEKVQRGEYPPRLQSPQRSNPPSPCISDVDETEPKHLTKKSSFVYSRNRRDVDEPDASTCN